MPTLARARYIGEGAYRPGLPARDIDGAEATARDNKGNPLYPGLEAAIAAGIYVAEYEPDDEAPAATDAPAEPAGSPETVTVASEPTFAEVRARAKALGIPIFGRSRAALTDDIAAAEAIDKGDGTE